jgi:crotonobetainyl-CoA:carnitine CoA-transferase CaiB-like acyl-CoA transferase
MRGALDGIVVIDLSRVLAGPYATMLLGDLGARVIKVEQPGRGDDTRRWGPPFTPNGESAYFLCANRNKESITLDLKHPTGKKILREMICRADILVENFKVDGMAALGLDYEALKESNPGLIYCSISGYGQTGPYSHRAGYDAVIQAEGGMMSITGPTSGADRESSEDSPSKVGVAVVDITAGLNAVVAILAALHARTVTGMGQAIDIALLDSQLGWLANVASGYLVSGVAPKRYGNAHPSIVPYQTFRASDRWLMVAVGNDLQFQKLCAVLGHVEWATDARFATNAARVQHRETLIPMLEREFALLPVADWTQRLNEAGIPCGPVNDIPTILADPQIEAREMVQQVSHPSTGKMSLIGPVPKLSDTPARIYTPPPLLGEHTQSILAQWLGYSTQEIEKFGADGVI